MKLKDLPLIYNLDKFKVYHNNRLLREEWIGAQSVGWYVQEDNLLRLVANRPIESMSIITEGCLSEVVTLEIYLK